MTPTELASRLRVAASQPEGILRASVRGLAAELEAEAKPPVPGACDPACPVCNATIPDPIVAGQMPQPEPSVTEIVRRIEKLEAANDAVVRERLRQDEEIKVLRDRLDTRWLKENGLLSPPKRGS